MRKYLIGIFIGAALTISSSAFADDVISLIGQKIQGEFPVKINGETLEKPAIVINGTSYLPNRAIADALGLDIKFDADLGIELKNKEEPMATAQTSSYQIADPTVTETTYSLEFVNDKIQGLKIGIKFDNISVEADPNGPLLGDLKKKIKDSEDELAIWESRKAALETNKTPTP